MMTIRIAALLTATALLLALSPAQAARMASADEAAVLASINEFNADFNKGDLQGVAALFAPQNEVTDEFPPFHWSGNGFKSWAADYAKMATASGDTGTVVHPGKPRVVHIGDGRAYVVMPAWITWVEKHKKTGESGDSVYVLTHVGGTWRIASWTWARR